MIRNSYGRTLLWTLVFSLLTASPVWADDEMTFDLDDVEASGGFEHLDELLADGKALYERDNFEEASLRFFDILMDDEWGAEAYFPEAEYELAKTLFRLELYQGALAYFGQIAEDDFHPYYEAALRGLLLLSDVIPGDATLTEHLSRYAPLFPDAIPDQYRDRYAYLVGRYFYDNMEIDEALRLLEGVGFESPEYAQARYIAGITHVANYDAEPAVNAFRDVLRFKSSQEAGLSDLRGQERLLLDLTHLAMARVYYSTGQYDTSISYYNRIDRNSPRWPDALFESSWGFFQLDEFNQALGNLHSLNSPFFADAYFPEGPILAAVIYFYNCNYNLVRDVLDDYEFIYDSIRDDLQVILNEHMTEMDMYDWGRQWRRGEVSGDPETLSALRAQLNDRQVQLRFDLVEAINREMDVMGTMSDSWQTSFLGDTLIQEAALAHSFATTDAGELAQQRLERIISEINDLVNQQNRILFEVARAERGEIEADIRAGMMVGGEEGARTELAISDEDLYWVFNGEYWKDELGFYFFDIRPECRR